ncbi:MAG: hypothetical protein QOG09_874, partial [Solirubrobacterales bacterium]|nr:hypothetical protein [Solirubrobacterales bacterium]
MDINRLRQGELIAAVSALLLFIFMFLDWYGLEVSVPGGLPSTTATVGGSGNAWDFLSVIPVILLLTCVIAIGSAALSANGNRLELGVPVSTIITAAGGLAVLLILYRIVDVPGPTNGGTYFGAGSVDVTRKIGIFLSLIAAAGVAYGGWRAMQEEGASFGEVSDRFSSGTAAGSAGRSTA